MKNRKMIIPAVSLVSVAMLFAFITFKPQAQTNNPNQANQQEQDEEPTKVTRGQVTNKQREYSKKYHNYSNPKFKLSEGIKLAEQEGYKGEIVRSVIPEPNRQIGQLPVSEIFRYLVCTSDAIVFGSPQSKTGQLTEDESWVYTEYDFLVKEILKDNLNARLEKDGIIQITRPGGLVKLDNYVFRIKDEGIQQLKKNKDYLLFLRYVPEVNGYIVASSYGDFVLNGNRFDSLSKAPLPERIKTDNEFQTIFNNVRNSVGGNCKSSPAGGN